MASPATVSRCGMVYLEPSILGLAPFVRCWLHSIPDAIKPHKERLEILFKNYLEVCVSAYALCIVCTYKYVYIVHTSRKNEEVRTCTCTSTCICVLYYIYNIFLPQKTGEFTSQYTCSYDTLTYVRTCTCVCTFYVCMCIRDPLHVHVYTLYVHLTCTARSCTLCIYMYVYTQPCIKVVRSSLKELVPTTDGNLTFSLTKILDCFFKPFIPKEVHVRIHCTLYIHVSTCCGAILMCSL